MMSDKPIGPEEKAQKVFEKAKEHLKSNRIEDAVIQFQTCLNIHPDCHPAHFELGKYYMVKGHYIASLKHFKSFLSLTPIDKNQAPALTFLGQIFLLNQDQETALQLFLNAFKLDPEYAYLHYNLGKFYTEHSDLERARFHLEKFSQLNHSEPESVIAHALSLLSQTYNYLGEHVKAGELFQHINDSLFSLNFELEKANYTPYLFESGDLLEERYENNLRALTDLGGRLASEENNPAQIIKELVQPQHLRWAYHKKDSFKMSQQLSGLLDTIDITQQSHFEDNEFKLIKVGLIASPDNGINQLFIPLIKQLNIEFDFVLFHSTPLPESITQEPTLMALNLPSEIGQQKEMILRQGLDFIFFSEIGPNTTASYHLAHLSLAPTKAVLPGFACSTGIASLTSFLCTELESRSLNAGCYSEALTPFSGTPFDLPSLPDRWIPKTAFNLPSDLSHHYLCPVALEKIGPDFYPVLQGILEKDPQAQIFMFQDPDAVLYKTLQASLQNQLGETLSQSIHFLPYLHGLSRDSLIHYFPVIIEPQGYGMHYHGIRALHFGTPIITWNDTQAPFLKELYLALELPECVANHTEDYVEKAVHISGHKKSRDGLAEKIKEGLGAHVSSQDYFKALRQFISSQAKRMF